MGYFLYFDRSAWENNMKDKLKLVEQLPKVKTY